MENIIHDIKSTVNSAVKKSGDLLEIGKVKLSLADAGSKLSDLYESLGEMAYRAKREEVDLSEEMESVIWQIDEMRSEIKKQKEKMAELRSQQICKNCGKSNVIEAKYCNECGAALKD